LVCNVYIAYLKPTVFTHNRIKLPQRLDLRPSAQTSLPPRPYVAFRDSHPEKFSAPRTGRLGVAATAYNERKKRWLSARLVYAGNYTQRTATAHRGWSREVCVSVCLCCSAPALFNWWRRSTRLTTIYDAPWRVDRGSKPASDWSLRQSPPTHGKKTPPSTDETTRARGTVCRRRVNNNLTLRLLNWNLKSCFAYFTITVTILWAALAQ